MIFFHHNILKAIKGYKGMLKKNLTSSKHAARIQKLGIKRIQIKNADEIKLYKIGLKIIAELEQHATTKSERVKSVNSYYGEEELLQYLKKLYSEYTIENGKIVNDSHKSSCALVTVIQLTNKAKEELTDEIAKQIYQCGQIIAEYGNQEQKKIFSKIISADQPQHMSFFFRQLQNRVSCLDES